jgi:hypothetical protein
MNGNAIAVPRSRRRDSLGIGFLLLLNDGCGSAWWPNLIFLFCSFPRPQAYDYEAGLVQLWFWIDPQPGRVVVAWLRDIKVLGKVGLRNKKEKPNG